MTRLAALIHDRRRLVLAVAVVLFALAGAFGTPVASKLTAHPHDFQDPHAENVRADDLRTAAPRGGAELGLTVLVPTARDARTDPGARQHVAQVAARLRAVDGIARVVAPDARTRDALTSRDGRTSLLSAARAPSHDWDDVAAATRRALAGDHVRVGGRQVTFAAIAEKVSHDLGRAELLAFPLLFLLSLWVFRSAVSAALPLLVGGLSIVVTFLGLRLVDAHVTTLSIFALNLVTGIGLGLGIDYSLFIVSRFREELSAGYGTREALARTLRTAGRTVLFSALTVAAACATLMTFPLRFLYSMGVGGTLVALVAAAVALTVLPAVLAVLGPRVNAGAPRRWRAATAAAGSLDAPGARGWHRLAHAVMRRPGAVALAATGLLLVLGLPFLRADFVAADWKMLPAGAQERTVAQTIEREFPAAAAEPVRVVVRDATAAQLATYRRLLTRLPDAGRVTATQPLGGGVAEIDLYPPGDAVGAANRTLVDRVRAVPAPGPVAVGGVAAAFSDQQDTLVSHLLPALVLLGGMTFVVLFLFTGSVVLPVKALLMNLLGLSAGFGILVWLFQDGHGAGVLDFPGALGLEATQPVLLAFMTFGLSTDYGVFLLSRIKEAHDAGEDNAEAVATGVARTGRIVTAAALLFCVAVLAFATSGILFIKQLGVGTALAVAIDATIIRAFLVPALMGLLGEWNWWAPRPLRRLHARIGLSETAA